MDSRSGTSDRSDLTEERLVALVSSGLDRAYRLAGIILGDAAEAEDATQDAIEAAWRGRASLRDPAAVQPWFDRILVNACRDRLRRRRRIAFDALDADRDAPEGADPFASVFQRDHVLRALAALDTDARAVVALHYWSDLPLTAVAERLGWPVGTVKTRLHRALEKMRSSLAMDESGKAGEA